MKNYSEREANHILQRIKPAGQYLCRERSNCQRTERYFRKHGTSRSFPQRHAGRNVPYRHQKTGDSKRNTPVPVISKELPAVFYLVHAVISKSPGGVIVAKRHIHMTPDEALALHIKDNDEVFVLTKSYGRALIYADVVVRVHRNYHLAMHVDTDEANAFNSDTNLTACRQVL